MRLLELARDGDESAFSNLARAYGVELRAHCYQMTGSLADAEDALQEGLLRAWAGLRTFEGRGSFRSWLYAVVTNAALDLIRRRSRRELPVPFGSSAASQADPGVPLPEHPWLDPHSEHWLADDARRSPEARYEERESVEFAFSVALHHLPPLQRTALLLREVVGLSAAEIAVQLGTTTPSVNSALQRARVAVRSGLHVGSEEPVSRALSDERTRATVHRYANAIERGDSDALISMLTRDVVPCQLPGVGAQFAGRAAELAELDRLLDGAAACSPW
jgi:RNA polymerase sigma-70 factor (ECF subfamily)